MYKSKNYSEHGLKVYKKCKFLIPDGNFYLCAATESDRIKNCISFCPTECKKFQSKKGKTAEDSSVIEGGTNGSL